VRRDHAFSSPLFAVAVVAGLLRSARVIEPLGYLNIQLGYG
jgi:hypothetical protein